LPTFYTQFWHHYFWPKNYKAKTVSKALQNWKISVKAVTKRLWK